MTSGVHTIDCADVPSPKGHYAHATAGNGLIFLSGQLPDPSIGANAGFDVQVRSAMGTLLAILRSAGGTPPDLLRVTAYIVGIEHWPEFNAIYAAVLGTAKPARTVVPVPALHYGWLIELDAVAVRT